MAYTYLIGWSKFDRWYYGCRFAKNCHPNDLWKTYFTSSKHIRTFREYNGEPDIIQIRKIFNNEKSCREWEHKVLRRLNVINNSKWLNETDNKAIAIEAAKRGLKPGNKKPRTKQWKQYISELSIKNNSIRFAHASPNCGMRNKHHSETTKQKLSLFWKGKKNPAHSERMKGRPAWNRGLSFQWITNGIQSKQINKDESIPNNWYRGRTM